MTIAGRAPRYEHKISTLGDHRVRRETMLDNRQNNWLIREAARRRVSLSHVLRDLVQDRIDKDSG